MTGLLLRLFVKNWRQVELPSVREGYGRLSGVVGIVLNLLLFAGKFTVGMLVSSISIRADAINNLSDAGSSVISLVSFKISSKPADREHPFGHARVEYIAAMIVSFLIIHIGLDVLGESVSKILHPTESVFSVFGVAVLVASIVVKGWLYLFNRTLGKRIHSGVLAATAADSLSDVLSTLAVLVSVVITKLTGWETDGYMGILVAILILISGGKIALEAADNLMGGSPDEKMRDDIIAYVEQYEEVLGIHDIIMHSYGPGKWFVSMHAEVDGNQDIYRIHDVIDNIERELSTRYGMHCAIHMDPLVVGDPVVDEIRKNVENLIHEMDERLSIHDFRMVPGVTHSNLIFDMAVPFECSLSREEIEERVIQGIRCMDERYFAVITFDRI